MLVIEFILLLECWCWLVVGCRFLVEGFGAQMKALAYRVVQQEWFKYCGLVLLDLNELDTVNMLFF